MAATISIVGLGVGWLSQALPPDFGTTASAVDTPAGDASTPAHVAAETTPGSGPGDYPLYTRISTPDGRISLRVPVEWKETIAGSGSDAMPYLAASPMLEGGFFDAYTHPGVSVELFSGADVDVEELLANASHNNCRLSGTAEIMTPWPGSVEYLEACGEKQKQLIHVTLRDESTNQTALVRIQAISAKDTVAADTIVDSLMLNVVDGAGAEDRPAG